MKALTGAIETTGIVEEANRLILDESVPLEANMRVRIIILPEDDDFMEVEWMRWLAANPAYDFLKNEEEDIYILADGKPVNVKG